MEENLENKENEVSNEEDASNDISESDGEGIREEANENIVETQERIEEEKNSEKEEIKEEKPKQDEKKEENEEKEPDTLENREFSARQKSEGFFSEKPENKPEDKIKEKPKDSKARKKTLAVIGIILVVIIIAVILFTVFFNPSKANNFSYNGFKFEKIQFGGIYLYETNITFLKSGKPFELNLRLRNDPRVLSKIPVNYTSFPKTLYFAFPEKTLNCSSDSLIAAFQVGQYLGNLGFSVVPAVTENFTGNTLPVINCSKATRSKGVVILKPFSEQNRIYQESNGCVILEAKNCSVIETSERFILSILEKVKASGESINTNLSNKSSNNSSNKSNSS